MNDKQNVVSVKWAVVTLLVVVLVIAASFVMLMMRPEKEVNNFEECVDAGGARMESYPEQCLYEGKTYVNQAQKPVEGENDYVGMTEEDALAKAEKFNTPARVVERDDEVLPVTMDFMYGRHNLYVRDGQVYKDEIEGEAGDSPMRMAE